MQGVDDVRRTWSAVARAWEEHRSALSAFTAPARQLMVEWLQPDPSDAVLELAGGAGSVGFDVARLADHVTCTDLSPEMVAAARRHAEHEGLANVAFEVADAQQLPYDADSFDAVVCLMGFMLMPDPLAAFAECRRVLRPGGRLVFATWGPPQDNPWVIIMGAALLQHGHSVQDDPMGPGGLFSLSESEQVTSLLVQAGFREPRTAPVAVEEVFTSFDEFWDLHAATGGPMTERLASLEPGEVELVRGSCREFAQQFADGDRWRFPGQALVAAAVA